jgi:hypothetical protein
LLRQVEQDQQRQGSARVARASVFTIEPT